jgi:hypothetical protein
VYVPKNRGAIPKELSWDGNPNSFDSYARKIHGHLSCSNMGYFLDPHLNKQYLLLGSAYFDSIEFQQQFKLHPDQPNSDNEYLFGLLTQTTTHELPALVKWGPTRDGLMVWNDWLAKYLNSGSDVLKAQELELAITNSSYKGKTLRDIPRFLDDFVTSLSKLEAIQAKRRLQGHPVQSFGDASKKMYLFQSLKSAPGVFSSLIMQLQRESQSNPHIPFETVIEDIRQQAILQEYDKAPPHRINMALEADEEMTQEEFLSIYNAMAMTSGYSEAYKQLSNPTLRAKLKIPNL